jgi:cytochrome c biogenesis protein CcdA/thiol-disulfide isomerase/thioredoxin
MRLRSGPSRRNLFGFALGFVFLFSTFTLSQETNTAVLYLFWGDGCPHCTAENQFLGELKGKYPALELRSFEVFNHDDNRQLFSDLVKAFGQEAKSVPTTILGDNIWIGFSESIAKDIESRVAYCLEYQACPDPTKRLSDDSLAVLEQPSATNLELPLLGTVNLTNQSLLLTTALIALVDGFNPCSLWVLSMLLAIVLYTGSRPKIFAIGLTFLLVAATVYALFIAGLFNTLAFVSYLRWVQIAIALLALTFAAINIKDYFFYKQGISLTIPESQKPRIYEGIRNIMAGDKTLPAMMGATALMALGVTLLELPCTAGLPVIWSGLVSQHNVPQAEFLLLLGVYLLVFLLDELLIFTSAVVTLKVSKLEEKQGRMLKLVGGMVMLALALVMLVKPDLMQSLGASLLVFGIALAASVLVFLIHKSMSPKLETSPKSIPKHTSHKKAHR